MKKVLLAIIIIMFLIPIVLASQSYHKINECDLYSHGDCLELEAPYDTKEISFKARIHPYSYRTSPVTEYTITSIRITEISSSRNSYNYDLALCNDLNFGHTKSDLAKLPINVKKDEWFYVKATGCKFEEEKWLVSNLMINYQSEGIPPQNYGEFQDDIVSTESIRGSIRKFIETPEYRRKQLMNKWLYRFIPIFIIAIFSLLGLIKVKR